MGLAQDHRVSAWWVLLNQYQVPLKRFYPPGTNSRAKPEQLVGWEGQGARQDRCLNLPRAPLNQFPPHSSRSRPGLQPSPSAAEPAPGPGSRSPAGSAAAALSSGPGPGAPASVGGEGGEGEARPGGGRERRPCGAEAEPTCLAQSSLLRLRPSCSSSRSRLMLSRSFCSCRPCHRRRPQPRPPRGGLPSSPDLSRLAPCTSVGSAIIHPVVQAKSPGMDADSSKSSTPQLQPTSRPCPGASKVDSKSTHFSPPLLPSPGLSHYLSLNYVKHCPPNGSPPCFSRCPLPQLQSIPTQRPQ